MFKWWSRVSSREQRLLLLTVSVLTLALAYLVFLRASDRIAVLDAAIDGLEEDLVFYSEQVQLLSEVDAAYRDIATQHSSAWTQEEIHDRLRREIARLSMREIPPGDSEVPLAGGAGQRLVEIREMPMGTLIASDDGYREYQIEFRIQPTSIQNITTFLERLHRSPQALRIQTLTLTRQPNSPAVAARMHVIRSVVDTEDAGSMRAPDERKGNWILNSGFEDWGDGQAPVNWTTEGATVTAQTSGAPEGQRAVLLTAQSAGATIYQTLELPAAQRFELSFALKNTGAVDVLAGIDGEGVVDGEALTLPRQDTLHRYHVRMTTPGTPGTAVTLRVPLIVIQEAGTEVYLDDVKLVDHTG